MDARNALIIMTLAALQAACAATGKVPATAATVETVAMHAPHGPALLRRAVGLGQAGLLYGRTVHVDPVVRPVSSTMSLASVILKSARGVLQRTSLRMVRTPVLKQSAIPGLASRTGMDLDDWEKELDRITGTKTSKGRIRFLVGGEEYFRRLTDAIDGARESIDVRTYIFDNDDFAVGIGNQLKASSHDVSVRVMVDGIGNLLAQQVDPASLPLDHVPPMSMSTFLEQDSRIDVRTLTNPWLTGDHTKTTIVDGKLAFVGGMNIGREYRYDWHDLMMEVDGPVVDQLQHDNDKAWARAGLFGDAGNFFRFVFGTSSRSDDVGYPVRVLYTRHLDSQIYRAQLAAIRQARKRIIIENAYFADDTVIYELARARRRGVDVRVILPDRGNHGPLNASNRVSMNHLLESGVRVYIFPGMTHVKAAVFDGWACVGSANYDKLSLEINRELNLATSHPEAVSELVHKVLLPDMARSRELRNPVDVTLATRLIEITVDELL
jgi:cardiolipin synthase